MKDSKSSEIWGQHLNGAGGQVTDILRTYGTPDESKLEEIKNIFETLIYSSGMLLPTEIGPIEDMKYMLGCVKQYFRTNQPIFEDIEEILHQKENQLSLGTQSPNEWQIVCRHRRKSVNNESTGSESENADD